MVSRRRRARFNQMLCHEKSPFAAASRDRRRAPQPARDGLRTDAEARVTVRTCRKQRCNDMSHPGYGRLGITLYRRGANACLVHVRSILNVVISSTMHGGISS